MTVIGRLLLALPVLLWLALAVATYIGALRATRYPRLFATLLYALLALTLVVSIIGRLSAVGWMLFVLWWLYLLILGLHLLVHAHAIHKRAVRGLGSLSLIVLSHLVLVLGFLTQTDFNDGPGSYWGLGLLLPASLWRLNSWLPGILTLLLVLPLFLVPLFVTWVCVVLLPDRRRQPKTV